MPTYTSILVNKSNEEVYREILENCERLKLTKNQFFNTLLEPAALRLKEMQDKRDIFNGNFGPLKFKTL